MTLGPLECIFDAECLENGRTAPMIAEEIVSEVLVVFEFFHFIFPFYMGIVDGSC
jgi:hypothetical protein